MKQDQYAVYRNNHDIRNLRNNTYESEIKILGRLEKNKTEKSKENRTTKKKRKKRQKTPQGTVQDL